MTKLFLQYGIVCACLIIALGLLQCISGCTFECLEEEVDCRVDSECDDGNACTADVCSEAGVCVNVYLPDTLCPEYEPEIEPEPELEPETETGPEPETETEPEPETETEPESYIWCQIDSDGDGVSGRYGRTFPEECPRGYIERGTVFGRDCDDEDDGTYPGADEICDGVDNNCDGEVDEGCEESETVWCRVDLDNDGLPGGYVEILGTECGNLFPLGDPRNVDCNDYNPDINFDADELCDGVDNDCDGEIDEGCEEEVGPVVQGCNGLDDDSDGEIDENDEWIGALSINARSICESWVCGNSSDGYVLHCSNPREPAPQVELCDGVDNDGDGEIDEGC